MDAPLQAGVASYDAGEYRVAARCWRRAADPSTDGSTAEPTDDERVASALATLARATAVASGAAEESTDPEAALSSLASLGGTHRGVDLDAARELLRRLADGADDGTAPRLRHDGRRLRPGDLSLDALGVAAAAVPAVHSPDDGDSNPGTDAATNDTALERVVADAVRFARETEGSQSTFRALLADYVAGRERATVRRRLCQHVARERRKDRDVDGLFE